ncbi:unnamed protein product [Knipowitschia caucasica]
MGRMILLLLCVSCWMTLLCARVNGQQLIKYIDESLTWPQAQAYCRQHHIDLVTITTEAENSQISLDSWLGMYRDNTDAEWKWSRRDTPHTFNNKWHDDDPDQDENCVYKRESDNGLWKSDTCTDRQKFYCLDDSLVLVKQKKTWHEALVHCRSLSSQNRTFDLATLITDEDHEYVRSKISGQVWIGLRFLGDRWVWVGGEQLQYDDLKTCPVISRCGVVDKNRSTRYSILKCNVENDFFCYRKSPA